MGQVMRGYQKNPCGSLFRRFRLFRGVLRMKLKAGGNTEQAKEDFYSTRRYM